MAKLSARRWAEAEFTSGDPRFVLKSIYELKPGDRIVIYCRRSRCRSVGGAEEQAIYYRAVAHSLGLIVEDVIVVTGSAYDAWQLIPAIRSARKHNATLVAATPNRFLRSVFFKSNDKRNHTLQATDEQWQELAWLADDVPLATFVPPNATPAEECSEHQKRSKALKLPMGERKLLQPVALDLRTRGWPTRKIARYLGKNESTIRLWFATI